MKCLCGNSMYRSTDGYYTEGFEEEAHQCVLTPKCRVLRWEQDGRVKWHIRQGATSMKDGPWKIGWALAIWDEVGI